MIPSGHVQKNQQQPIYEFQSIHLVKLSEQYKSLVIHLSH